MDNNNFKITFSETNENFNVGFGENDTDFATEFHDIVMAGAGGTTDYNDLQNKPQINSVELIGNKTLTELGIQGAINDLDTIRSGANKGATSVQPSDITDMATKTWVEGKSYATETYVNNHHDSSKQDTINDLSEIRQGASKGETALQPNALTPYRTSANQDIIDSGKVDKVTGKGLSTNDYTDSDKALVSTALQPSAISDMATKTWVESKDYATETYVDNHHDSTKQDVINDLSTIRSGASKGATSLQQSDIIDNVSSTSTNKTLSANQGKLLNDRINNLSSIGRFLSIWDASTGTPTSEPTSSPYEYKVGDYYRIGVAGTKNPAPNSTYTVGGTNWVEGGSLGIGDVLYVSNINGSSATWTKQASGGGGTVQDVQVNSTSVLSGGIANITLGSFGITASETELNYTDGVTSNIQTQLDSKTQVIWRTY